MVMPHFATSCWQRSLAQGLLVDQWQSSPDQRLSLVIYEGERFRIEESATDEGWQVRRVVWHDRLIIEAGSPQRLDQLAPILAQLSWRIRDQIRGTGCASLTSDAVDLRAGVQREEHLRLKLADDAVLEAEVLEPLAGVPSDSDWDKQWNAIAIGAPTAWDLHTGDERLIVPVFDTGVAYTHPDLRANIFINANEIPDNGIDDDRNGYIDDIHGWDFLDNDADPADSSSHGTHVAGIIGAAGDNAIGTAGIMWHVRIMPIRIGSQAGINTYAERSALEYVRRWRTRRGAAIVASNHSYGATDSSPSEQRRKAIGRYRDAGILLITAAGNSNSDNDTDPHYPSGFDLVDFPNGGDWDNVLAVAASTEAGERYSGSNYGETRSILRHQEQRSGRYSILERPIPVPAPLRQPRI